MEHIERAVAAIRHVPPTSGYLIIYIDQALHVLRHGAPLSAAHVCCRDDVSARNLYDNHSGALKAAEAVMKKIVSASNNHFVLVFPRWVWRFIYGLFLSPIGFIERKHKGRVVVDPSAHLHEDGDTGALNDNLDKLDQVAVPPTFYATAQRRHWRHIWNLRVAHPSEEILLYKDDINADFHRARYPPDLSTAYSYVWLQWLVIHIGIIFGGRDSPGWFYLLSELRAAIAMHYIALPEVPPYPLVTRVSRPTAPTAAIATAFAQAQACILNPGTGPVDTHPTHHATFVDDNLMAEIHRRAFLAIQRSTASC